MARPRGFGCHPIFGYDSGFNCRQIVAIQIEQVEKGRFIRDANGDRGIDIERSGGNRSHGGRSSAGHVGQHGRKGKKSQK